MPIITLLQHLGLSEKEIQTYLVVLKSGPSPVRKISKETRINRGTTYDLLKSLIKKGILSYYHKDKHQYFSAEDPSKLKDLLEQREHELERLKNEINKVIPELKSLQEKMGAKPVVKYYEGLSGIKTILKDVLNTSLISNKEYCVYSSSAIKKYLYEAYPRFSADRIKAKVRVQTVSVGPGGTTVGLDERKWLTKKKSAPTYILIYSGKVAMISVDEEGNPLGVIIEDYHIFQTQKMIFDFIWNKL